MRGLVREQNAAIAIGADDRDGAGLDEMFELLFEATTHQHLGFEPCKVCGCGHAAPVRLEDVGTDTGERGE